MNVKIINVEVKMKMKMDRMKRMMAVIVTIAMFATLLSGCGFLNKLLKQEEHALTDTIKNAVENAEKKAETSPDEEQGDEAEEDKTEDLVPEETEFSLYEEMSKWEFHFCSGAGGWETYLYVAEDGSFSGQFHDSDMGDTGPGYENGTIYMCDFHGKFGDCEQVSDFVWSVKMDELAYERTPDEEEILDEVRYIYAGAYGLEGLKEGESELLVYLPGTPIEELDEAYMEWIRPMHFGTYFGEDFEYVYDPPQDLPFCGLYNTVGDGFYSDNGAEHNGTYVVNRAKLPGLKNEKAELHEDGTYLYEDMDPYGMVKVTNACFFSRDEVNTYSDQEGFVRKCLDGIGVKDYDNLYVPDKDASMFVYDKMSISGEKCSYASWTEGSNEDSRNCSGCFLQRYCYNSDYDQIGWYGFVYMISQSEYADVIGGEATNFYLSSLELSGNPERLSSASEHDAASKILTQTVKDTDASSLRAQEVYWVTESDTDLIEKYHLDPDEFYDDYQIAGFTGDFSEYPVAEDCLYYVQYPEDKYHKLLNRKEFDAYISRYDSDGGMLMDFILDEKGCVVMVYEPYTP